MNAGVDRVDIVQNLVRTSAAHQLHGRLAGEAWKRLGPIPGVCHQRRTEPRLDLVDDLDHLAKAALRPARTDAILALNGILSESGRASDLLARRAEGIGDLARSEISA